jgi:hypothetical protein
MALYSIVCDLTIIKKEWIKGYIVSDEDYPKDIKNNPTFFKRIEESKNEEDESMEKITLAEVAKISNGMPVDKIVSGTIKVINAQKKDVIKKDGKEITTLQQGIALEDSTGSVWVWIKDHDSIPSEAKGKTIQFEGWYDETHKKWAGMSKSSYEKEGKTKVTLNVTKTGKMKIMSDEQKSEDAKKEEKPSTEIVKDESKNTNVDTSKDTKDTTKTQVVLGKEEACKNINADFRCICIVEVVKSIMQQTNSGRYHYSLADMPVIVDSMIKFYLGDAVTATKMLSDIDAKSIPFGNKEVGE